MPRSFVRHERTPRDTRTFKVYMPQWVDPYWFLVGSSIEKMVLAELARRGVFFIFRSQTNNLGGFVDPTWEADFLLPQHKIWIEIQGSYFHSLPGQLEKDSLRFAAIEMAGWKPVFLWEFDIRTRLPEILDEIGVFYIVDRALERRASGRFGEKFGASRIPGQRFAVGGELVDQLVGLRKALSARAQPVQMEKRYATMRRPK